MHSGFYTKRLGACARHWNVYSREGYYFSSLRGVFQQGPHRKTVIGCRRQTEKYIILLESFNYFFFKLAYVAENLINPGTSALLYETAFEHLFSSFSSFYLFVFCSSSNSSPLSSYPEMSWKGVLLLYLL